MNYFIYIIYIYTHLYYHFITLKKTQKKQMSRMHCGKSTV